MKIISKYKDYYDFLSGIYGVDDKVVLDRRGGFVSTTTWYNRVIRLYICGMVYEGLEIREKFYWGDCIKQFECKKPNPHSLLAKSKLSDSSSYIILEGITYPERGEFLRIVPYKDDKNLNDKFSCPILQEARGCYSDAAKFPKLETLGIASILPPNDIYLMLVEWLSRTENIIDTRDDKQKILSAGFDLKTSFRKM